jgi:hypothetical protein
MIRKRGSRFSDKIMLKRKKGGPRVTPLQQVQA